MSNHQLPSKNIIVPTTKSLGYTLLFLLLISATCANSRAETMGNDNYLLKADVNLPVAKETNENIPQNTITPTPTSTYHINTGFQFLQSKSYFRFSIPDLSVDFGELTPTDPQKRTSILSVNPGSTIGYSVLASENHALQNTSKNIIPDTTCDDGQCNETTSSPWTNPLTFGFGYNTDDLTDNYQQFANEAKNETPFVVMTGGKHKNKTQVTYKVNISQTQAQGWYNNSITYVATPNF